MVGFKIVRRNWSQLILNMSVLPFNKHLMSMSTILHFLLGFLVCSLVLMAILYLFYCESLDQDPW